MEKKLKILAIIPARGGSKGVPRKNIRPLAGKSLIQRTFEIAKISDKLDRIILSSDDEEIVQHGKNIGIDVPFVRPQKLAADTSPMVSVIFHALEYLKKEENYVPYAVMVLQPTSPLRKTLHIERAIKLLEENDAVCSLIQVPMEMSPYYVMKITDKGYVDYFLPEGRKIIRRQDAPKAFLREGTVYLTTVEALYKYKDLYGERCIPMIISNDESLSIDTIEEWSYANEVLSKKEGYESLNPINE